MDTKPVVLIVDDEPANVQVLAACIKDQYRLKVATDAQRCLELAVAEPLPDLILLDVEMPGMTGYEAIQQLKEGHETKDIPVIFVTGRDHEQDEEYGLSLGAVDYITKPIRPAIVAARTNTHVLLKQQQDLLKQMALVDQLTGLYNRHYLLTASDQKVAQAQRHQQGLSLMMIDIDHFKSVNDNHGHPAGDRVLNQVAQVILEHNRKEDIAARFGGEEFVVLLDGCDLEAAEYKAEQLRKAVEQLKPEGLDISISIGVSRLAAGVDDFTNLLSRADQAVYQAKQQGRNRVVIM